MVVLISFRLHNGLYMAHLLAHLLFLWTPLRVSVQSTPFIGGLKLDSVTRAGSKCFFNIKQRPGRFGKRDKVHYLQLGRL